MILAGRNDPEGEMQRKSQYRDQLQGFEVSLRQCRRQLGPRLDPFSAPLWAVDFLRSLETDAPLENPAELEPAGLERWAEAQRRIHRGRERLGTVEAIEDVDTAIQILKDEGFWRQVELQGLFSLLAKAHRLAGRDVVDAVRHAEQSVAQEPGSAARRWILADVYSALGDFEDACLQRETAMRLGPSFEVLTDLSALRRIARDYLLFSDPQDRPAPQARVRRGLRFFERALLILESRRPTRSPVQCAAHAAAHYWLGRFHCELNETDLGLDHLRVARSIGFYPIELGLQMGHVYSYKRDYEDAERAFSAALRATRRRTPANGSLVLADNGPLEALEVEALLSWAMLRAERAMRLQQASRLCERAGKRLGKIPGERRRLLRALYYECRGWILFQEDKIEESRKELERAARTGDSPSIQARLARVYETAGEVGLLDSEDALRKAAQARGRFGGVNGNGYRRGVFDLLLLPQRAGAQSEVGPSPAIDRR
jgi:tetratricopeptide (TPR) repeat protein